jgi:hypothetical protein
VIAGRSVTVCGPLDGEAPFSWFTWYRLASCTKQLPLMTEWGPPDGDVVHEVYEAYDASDPNAVPWYALI